MPENASTIEQEIAQLEKQIQEKRANFEQNTEQKETPTDREILRQVVGEKLQQHMPTYSPPIKTKQDDAGASYLAPEIKEQVQELVNIVFQNSLGDAIKQAAKFGNPALIDAFHDVLVDQLYDVLLERKKIDPIS